MSGLSKDLLVFSTTNPNTTDNVGAYLRAADGSLLTQTTIGGKVALDVNVASGDLIVDLNGIYNASTNPNPDNVGIVAFSRNAAPGLAQQIQALTAATPTSDGVVAANVDALDANSFLMGYNGTTWDRIKSASGSLSVNVSNTTLAVTQSGTWTVQQGTPPWSVAGNVADAAADSGNPVKTGARAVSGALTAATAGNRVDNISDLYRRLLVNSAARIASKASAVSVTTAAVALPTTALAGRQEVIIKNNGVSTVFIGDATVTSSTGIPLGSGGSISLEVSDAVPMFAIGSALAADLRILELA